MRAQRLHAFECSGAMTLIDVEPREFCSEQWLSVGLKRVGEDSSRESELTARRIPSGQVGYGRNVLRIEFQRLSLSFNPFVFVNCGARCPVPCFSRRAELRDLFGAFVAQPVVMKLDRCDGIQKLKIVLICCCGGFE